MVNSIQSIALDKLVPHPDNPNRMSKANLNKLVRNIKRSGLYEPLVVRTHPKDHSYFEIINGLHRCKALKELGYEEADCVVWEMNDEQADILLATLNRLGGSDELGKKLKLLKRLNEKSGAEKLAKLLPQTAKQIERLSSMLDAQISMLDTSKSQIADRKSRIFATLLVFFVNDSQQQTIDGALSLVVQNKSAIPAEAGTKAAKRAAALTYIAQYFLDNSKQNGRQKKKDRAQSKTITNSETNSRSSQQWPEESN